MALKSWGIASFTVDTWTELVVGEAGEEADCPRQLDRREKWNTY